jgi:hypothetical protein
MSFKKPFRAVPIRLGPHYRAQRRRDQRKFAAKVLGGAVAIGLAIGLLAALTVSGALVHKIAVPLDLVREHIPPPSAYYSGCDEARAAGVAPLYVGEPGYRPEMDGDDDGIACEPYRGR